MQLGRVRQLKTQNRGNMVGNDHTGGWAVWRGRLAWVLAVLGASVLLVLGALGLLVRGGMIAPWGGHMPQDPVAPIASAISRDVQHIAQETGVIFPSGEAYMRSRFGSSLQSVGRNKMNVDGWRLSHLRVQIFRHRNSYRVGVTIRASRGRSLVGGSTEVVEALHPVQRTKQVLASVTAGVPFWRALLIGQAARKELSLVPVSPIPRWTPERFGIGEFAAYKRWLIQVLGSPERLVDGWDRSIRLSLQGPRHAAQLVAQSAGPDGRWNTHDDMLIKRDTKTGKIVEKKGW